MLHNNLLKPDWPEWPAQIGAFSTLRSGGVSLFPYDDGSGFGGFNLADHVGDPILHVEQNRALLARLLPEGLTLQWLTQVHGSDVVNLDEHPDSLIADACITTKPGVVCSILTADCLPVLFCDAKNGVVGVAHAGWRGLAGGILENTISAMEQAGGNPENMVAWLGPAIGPRRFEVGIDVRSTFADANAHAALAFKASEAEANKFYADIYQLARMRLQQAGIHRISGGHFCTVSEPEKFYSYRRDGITGRMASLIWL